MKMVGIALGLASALLVVVAVSLAAPARAQQGGLLAPANVRVADEVSPGAVAVSWDGVEDAAFYRIGWVASDRIAAALAAGREWQDAFAFADVANLGQTAHRLTDLAPGGRYAFIVGSINARFGVARWSEWAYLTLAEAPATVCPTATPMPTPTPGATPGPAGTPAPMPTPVPPAPTPSLSPTLTLPTPTPHPAPAGTGNYDYDADEDGLIEVASLAQLDAIRADMDGDGVSHENGEGLSHAPAYAAAFPNAKPGMGCPYPGCTGYELVADLDFDTNGNGAADAGDAYWNDGAGWVPIGDVAHKFTADFDGNNHTIANLYINRVDSNYVGLFGYVSDGHIKHIGLASATVFGSLHVGGLVGYTSGGAISASYATGNVSGSDIFIGGLIGYNINGTIDGSYTTSTVYGRRSVGGLVGYIYNGSVRTSYATGSVFGSGNNVGGLVGDTEVGTISTSYATGNVSGGGRAIGGLVGKKSGGSVTASYAIGRVSTSGDTFYVGGLVGYDRLVDYDHDEGGNITASYWDTQTTGQTDSWGGIGKTTADLQSPTGATGIYADWDAEHWDFGNSTQYPVLEYGDLDVAAQRR